MSSQNENRGRNVPGVFEEWRPACRRVEWGEAGGLRRAPQAEGRRLDFFGESWEAFAGPGPHYVPS